MSEWQPIETAPRDGTEILGWCEIGVVVVSWNEQRFHKNPKPYWDSNRQSVTWMREYCQPTHWQPLPQPPKETA